MVTDVTTGARRLNQGLCGLSCLSTLAFSVILFLSCLKLSMLLSADGTFIFFADTSGSGTSGVTVGLGASVSVGSALIGSGASVGADGGGGTSKSPYLLRYSVGLGLELFICGTAG